MSGDDLMTFILEVGSARNHQVGTLHRFLEAQGDPRPCDHVKWRLRPEAADQSILGLAFGSGEKPPLCVGSYALLRSNGTLSGSGIKIGQSVDAYVSSDYQGHGIFSELASQVHEVAQLEHIDVLYGILNDTSLPIFQTRLGFRNLGPVPFLIRPLSLRSTPLATLRGSSDWRVPLVGFPKARKQEKLLFEDVESFTDDHTHVWQSVVTHYELVGVDRSSTYLNYRFVENPMGGYFRYAIYSDSNCLGFVVWTAAEKHNRKIGYILEMLHLPNRTDIGRLLLRFALREMQALHCDLALAWNSSHSYNRAAYRREFFAPLPKLFRPIHLHFTVRSLNQALDPLLYDARRWYLSYSDSDTI